MKVKCEINGRKFTEFIKGDLADAEKCIEISRCEELAPNCEVLTAYPQNDDYVEWIDTEGEYHRALFFKDKPFAVHKDFIVD